MPILLLLACTGTPTPSAPIPVDVNQPAEPGTVRAGAFLDAASLPSGLSAEAQVGDLVLYNDRARFVIQGDREGSSYIGTGGILIDADVIRAPGEPGNDLVEDWLVMPGLGRVVQPSSVEVISDGRDGTALIRVTGVDAPMDYLVGALESDALIRPQGLEVVVEYVLRPDTPLLEVRTTVTATREVRSLALGDALIGSVERATPWTQGLGRVAAEGEKESTGFIGTRNDGAIAMLSRHGERLQGSGAAFILTDNLRMTVGFDEAVMLEPGDTRTWTRWWGVGPDLAALTDARLAETATQTLEGVITADDGPVAGALVHVLDDGSPYTVGVTGEDGSYRIRIPESASPTLLADGRGDGMFFDLPPGWTSIAPFSHPDLTNAALESLSTGGSGKPAARGRGWSAGNTLGVPATLVVSVDDAQPFSVRLGPGIEDGDVRLMLPRPDDQAATGWSRGSPLTLLTEPGTYDLVVSRGTRFELHQQSVTLVAGQTVTVNTSLAPAFDHSGYLWADPHSHATPSHDGRISMEERLIVHSASGVQLHVGSDHDRIADYRPIVGALGLEGTLQSIVADEVSPLLRGHMNAYPLQILPDAPNQGAHSWWQDVPTTTQALADALRVRHGDMILQANHPMDSGVAEAADWRPGVIGNPGFWVNDLDAMEVLNGGAHADYFPVWLDLVSRGQGVIPVGVSDSHTPFEGPPGLNGTWVGTSRPVGGLSDQDLLDAYASGDIQVGLGVFLDLSVRPGTLLTSPTNLTVTARTPSWASVDRLHLYQNDVIVQTVEGSTATFELGGTTDTLFVVVAEGDTPMNPIAPFAPWATTNAYRYDADGNGWTAALPPLALE